MGLFIFNRITGLPCECQANFWMSEADFFFPFSGATTKDTRTKSRGRVEVGEGGGTGWGGVEGRGENADNCT